MNERFAVIRKEKGQYCVRSPNNPDWNGGCYDSKSEAEDRLKQVEFFKHKGATSLPHRIIYRWILKTGSRHHQREPARG